MNEADILLVDDDDKLRRVLSLRLSSDGYHVVTADSGPHALDVLKDHHPKLVLADLRMPGMDGLELLEHIQRLQPSLPVVILTAHGGIPQAVSATKRGAAQFLTKPVERDELNQVLEKYISAPTAEDLSRQGSCEFITRAPHVRKLLADVKRAARADSSVLICGPSGSGKEVLARVLHRASRRRKGPFIAVNCGAIPADLLESELFGYRKGAFTGADNDHPGLFRSAEGGSLFLDEIGDMPAQLQVKLLRVLQEREVRPVGALKPVSVNVRVISATHRDLETAVAQGMFREDLFYRLNVVSFALPGLDERREDIPALVKHQLQKLHQRGEPRRVFSEDALDILCNMSWPGNVRQLFNVVEQAVALSSTEVISAAFLRGCIGEAKPRLNIEAYDKARADFTRNYLRNLLQATHGNVSRAARLAERNRTDLYKLLNRHNVKPSAFKQAR